ncbi:hypothetical protein U9M48_041262 [Paspalum notatum var. saurae]|uniref:Auxin-responsive protein n=1 Tax=Paspalum notatum var. saurae TaxID=547442 RepID=A0AAQ3UMV5_PASNO
MKSSTSSAAAQRLELKQEPGLDLRLGFSSSASNNGAGGGGGDPWLGVGVHPWSLAARQEKAALEHHQAAQQQRPPPPPAQPVGWPPVGAFRKNHLLGGARGGAVEELERKAKPTVGPAGDGGERRAPAPAATMFVKVNLEGCAVGRKVDLQAHPGYAALSRALQAMFHGFLSADAQWRIAGREEDDDDELRRGQQQLPEARKKQGPHQQNKKAYILLYEDNEGDRMLVGDVPWELFMASVKRLYIAQDPRKKN